LLELAMASLGFGWRPRETSAREVS